MTDTETALLIEVHRKIGFGVTLRTELTQRDPTRFEWHCDYQRNFSIAGICSVLWAPVRTAWGKSLEECLRRVLVQEEQRDQDLRTVLGVAEKET